MGVGVGLDGAVAGLFSDLLPLLRIIKAIATPAKRTRVIMIKIRFENILNAIIDSMKKIYYVSLLVFVVMFLSLASTPSLAAKKRVWGKNIVVPTTQSKSFSASARFTGWKQYLNVSFRGVTSTQGINYELIYSSNGVDQGAGGRVNAGEGNVTRKMFLGTCSHGVCVAHKNISNVRLRITYTTAGGQIVAKNYRVKY